MKKILVIGLAAGALSVAVLSPVAVGGTPASASVTCHAINGHNATKTLPDRHCTPGAINSTVNQSNIRVTICTPGWTTKVRPPASYTNKLKIEQIGSYRYSDRRVHDYEEDHLVPLELGGSPRSVKNLWPEYDAGKIPNAKDKVENALNRAVCGHRVSLKAAQQAIAANWTTARARLHV